MPLNVSSKSDDWRARRLSNFYPDSFVLDREQISSVEGFIQGIKFPPGDPTRQLAFLSTGVKAKRLGVKAVCQFVWWRGRAILYGSADHHRLIERAIRARFEQNTNAMYALIATRGLELTHDLGEVEHPKTSLPARMFCRILTQIRG